MNKLVVMAVILMIGTNAMAINFNEQNAFNKQREALRIENAKLKTTLEENSKQIEHAIENAVLKERAGAFSRINELEQKLMKQEFDNAMLKADLQTRKAQIEVLKHQLKTAEYREEIRLMADNI